MIVRGRFESMLKNKQHAHNLTSRDWCRQCRAGLQIEMPKTPKFGLSRREQEIMEVLFRRGRSSASEVRGGMTHPPSYSAVRATLRVLEEKGYIRQEPQGLKWYYEPTINREEAGRSAIRQTLDTFFNNSPELMLEILLKICKNRGANDEIERMKISVDKKRISMTSCERGRTV
jgi:BlaI family penicillinase repressor